MRAVRIVVVIALAAIAAAGCSKDPLKRSRDSIASGDRYAADKKFKEAVIEYRNAVQADPRSGEARSEAGRRLPTAQGRSPTRIARRSARPTCCPITSTRN